VSVYHIWVISLSIIIQFHLSLQLHFLLPIVIALCSFLAASAKRKISTMLPLHSIQYFNPLPHHLQMHSLFSQNSCNNSFQWPRFWTPPPLAFVRVWQKKNKNKIEILTETRKFYNSAHRAYECWQLPWHQICIWFENNRLPRYICAIQIYLD